MTIGQRLRAERERLALSQTALGDACGVKKGTQIRYEAGDGYPGADYLAAAAGLGVDVLYVVAGRREAQAAPAAALVTAEPRQAYAPAPLPGELPGMRGAVSRRSITAEAPASSDTPWSWGGLDLPRVTDLPSRALLPDCDAAASTPLVLQAVAQGGQGGRDFQVIPHRMRPAAAGPGAAGNTGSTATLDLAGLIAVDPTWLRRQLGAVSGPVATVHVIGDSMDPTLHDGDTILIDQGVSTVVADGVYVLDVGGATRVKRVQAYSDGSIVLISDNPRYGQERLDRGAARDVRVIGRVIRRMVWPTVG